MRGLRLLACKHGSDVRTSFFMGARTRNNKCMVELSEGDSDAEQQHQFNRLKSQVMEPKTCVIFHLSNHYALVYGMREWRDEGGVAVREVLTARKGQRPSAWIGFGEVRDLMIRVQSYKMIVVRNGNKVKRHPLGIMQR